MKFALFYEIPVPRPWSRESEHQAFKNTLEQAILGDRVGFDAFWTVEHHFLEEFCAWSIRTRSRTTRSCRPSS